MTAPNTGASSSPISSAQLFERWRRHQDRQARDELIQRFLPLARKLARRYVQSSEPYEDLVQVASLGLVKAVERFDPDRGFAFSSFAVPTIVGELKRYFRDTAWALHVDRGAQERARKITDAQQKLSSRSGRMPTVDELAQYLEMSQEEVLDGLQTAEAYGAVSLDAPMSTEDDEESSRLDAIGSEDERLALVNDHATIFAAARHLPTREREILYLRFGEDLTQSEIADRVGVSQMQVSRLLRRSLHRLRELTEERSYRPLAHQRPYQRRRPPAASAAPPTKKPISHSTTAMTRTIQRKWTANPSPPNRARIKSSTSRATISLPFRSASTMLAAVAATTRPGAGTCAGKRMTPCRGRLVDRRPALARIFPVGLATRARQHVVALIRRVLDGPAGRMLIAVAGVLDQFLLGLLEALGLPLAGFGQRALGLIRLTLDRRRL